MYTERTAVGVLYVLLEMKCPRDNTNLAQEKLEKKTCLRCPLCMGYFISLTGPKLQGITLSRLNPKSQSCALKDEDTPLISPFSGNPMKHFVYKEISLDYCQTSNSVWMDEGELQSVAKKFVINKKITKSSSEYGLLDGIGDGVISAAVDLVGGLFDGI